MPNNVALTSYVGYKETKKGARYQAMKTNSQK